MERSNTSIAIDESRSIFLDYSPLKGPRVFGEMADNRAGTGKVQDDLVRLMVPKTK